MKLEDYNKAVELRENINELAGKVSALERGQDLAAFIVISIEDANGHKSERVSFHQSDKKTFSFALGLLNDFADMLQNRANMVQSEFEKL